ncbi:hypothetical protein [Streptomyces sp. 1222.5]|uniref:hypothetical protein n=1 Tax=Streptomyces sp. 1222.5 TaxID=1881026 RepID=UPI003EBE9606
MDFMADRDIDAPLILLAIAVVAGPALFCTFIGLGYGMSALGWTAGIASTGILVSLTYASLFAASDGHGFAYWLLLTMIVACNLGAFCVTCYAFVRGTRQAPLTRNEDIPGAFSSRWSGACARIRESNRAPDRHRAPPSWRGARR